MASDFGMSSSKYGQEEKGKARVTTVQHTIHCLTAERSTSACVQRNYPRDLWNQSLAAEKHWSQETIQSMNESLEEWEHYYDSQILTKKPSDLRVLFLGGDDPIRDLEVLTRSGGCPYSQHLGT